MRILVVDDGVVATILRTCNYQVTTVKYPMDALSTLSLKGDSFDLVVTNVHVPDMNGFDFPQVITQGFELPVVLNSADNKDGSKLKGLKKVKVEWTTSLHHKFLVAIIEIGLDKVTPLKILDHMKVPGLTRDNVASHLQRYRIFLQRVTDSFCKTQAADKKLASKAVQENCGLDEQFFENTRNPSSSLHTSTGYLTGNLQHLKNKGKEVDAVLDPVCNSSVFHNINATQQAQRIGDLRTSFMNQGNVQPHQLNNEDEMSVNFDRGINQDMEEKDPLQ
ncbi:putative two-component response regulator ARR21 isoform X1 [Lycium barbarum]|uniref:putative two-component response regulator ARR21 isoform X1 n=2 Tax=Lycium barbarum TaxID=112863 RepID=UPI00293EE429|nr:putative two-component response regulator ARR21 isoform X1 [Lycium barbarum]XP_060170150.1 putative two-component response regulator ARR21 isoform X1 [Lycium barbarum]XP_060170151.1 putative two-component response regulator ARR21 isoform X1 [Lycium barbarum]